MKPSRCLWLILLAPIGWVAAMAEERHESFDKDPGWEGRNNRSAKPAPVRQDFGWSPGTTIANGTPGEIGGIICPAAEPAYYAKKISTRTFNNVLTASGRLKAEKGAGHTLIGFFNARTLNEWRTPNTLALRIQQRGEILHCHLEHCTSKWRAGAGIIGRYDKLRDRMVPKELPCGRVYAWSLKYDPRGHGEAGVVTATLDGETSSYELSPEHKSDGAEFDHFGIVNVMKQLDGSGRLWLGDVTVNGEREDFSSDPRWDGSGNRRTYETLVVRPRFDFGFTRTHFAGGSAAGELGGLFFRGDCRYGERLAAYGDRLSLLTLERPLRASGKVCLRRGVSDSTTLIGFYHSVHSLAVNPSQEFSTPQDFLGAAIEGPSREGFLFYPVYRNHGSRSSSGLPVAPVPAIHPDGATHNWTLEYDPGAANGSGRMTVTLDGKSVTIDLAPGVKTAGAEFDRFGLVTPWIDGNGQHVYFDDLNYTWRQQ
jgi:hypothetical protein